MTSQEDLPIIAHSFDDDWGEGQATFVDEPYLLRVRKLDAPPGDDVEEIETVRGQLHASVDHLVDRALKSVGELRAIVEKTRRDHAAMDEELQWVVRHANAVVEATAPRRRSKTLLEFPTAVRAGRSNRTNAPRPAVPRARKNRLG